MDNAIASKDALNLSVGISLSAEQVAALTHDIVWMEQREVMGETVLVPVLYMAQAEGRLAPNGALIQRQDLALISGGDLSNQGTLRATNNLSAQAQNIQNSGLMQAGERLSLLAVLAGSLALEREHRKRVLHLDGVAGLTDDLLAILDLRGVISDVQLLHDHYSPFAAALRIARSSFS